MVQKIYWLNLEILFSILVVMFVLYLVKPDALDHDKYRSTSISFLMFAGAIVCLLSEYALVDLPQDVQDSYHRLFHVVLSLVSDIASICVFTAAIAYRRGAHFDSQLAVRYAIRVLVGLFLWYVGFELFDHRLDLTATMVRLSPGIIIAVIALTALGWSFYIRWGPIAGGPFLLVCLGYSAFQLPANLNIQLAEFFGSPAGATVLGLSSGAKSIADHIEATSIPIFQVLAAGKILLTFGFLSLLCASTLPEVQVNESRDWYGPQLRPPVWIGWASIVTVVGAVLTGVWGHIIASIVAKLVLQAFGVPE